MRGELEFGVFSRGGDSLPVSLAMHGENRDRLREKFAFPSPSHALVLFGGQEISVYNTDTHFPGFKQESYFQWLVGAKEPDLVLVMTSEADLLFVPQLPDTYETWMGPRKTRDWFRNTYGMHAVEDAETLATFLADKTVIILTHRNLDSGLDTPQDERTRNLNVDETSSQQIGFVLDELRAVKTPAEIAVLQFANDVSCKAHIEVMQEMGKNSIFPCASREYYAEAVFRFGCAARGCARVGYDCIACSGERNAILHYGHPAEANNHDVPVSNHLRLLDMGAEYHCYTADVTNTFPAPKAEFSPLQRAAYECVWETVLFVERMLKPGVHYGSVHVAAQKQLLKQLILKTHLLKPEFRTLAQVDYLSDTLHIVPRLFMPHGLGHMLGLDVHDVGGYLPGEPKSQDISMRGLRLSRPLKAGFVLTVEPGLYFIQYLKRQCMESVDLAQVVDWQVWDEFQRDVGGVRIEDDVLITETGCRILTDLPRTPDDVVSVMRQALPWTVGANRREYFNY